VTPGTRRSHFGRSSPIPVSGRPWSRSQFLGDAD
jgi:hypothetical protein